MELIERDEQSGCLDRALAQASAGHGRAVLVEGPATSGKTELLRTFTTDAQAAGARVLDAVCAPAERALAFGVLGQLAQGTAVAGAAEQVCCALAADAATPEPATAPQPDAGPEPATGPQAAGVAAGTDRNLLRAVHNLSLALLDLAAERPLVLAVDDVHYADEPSRQVLLHLVRRLGSARVLMLLTDAAEPGPPHSSFRAELLRHSGIQRLRLAPLSPAGVTRLIAGELDPPTAGRLAGDAAQISGGNPLLLRALVDDLRTAGEVRPDGYGLAVLSCLHRGPASARAVVRARAVLGNNAPPAELTELAGVEPGVVDRTLGTLTAAGVLDAGRLRHPAARAGVLDALRDEDRAELQGRAARLRHERGASADVVAGHLTEAGEVPEPWAVDVLWQAAEQALLEDAGDRAAGYLELAHRSCQDEPDRAVIEARLAQADWQVDPSRAARHLDPLAGAVRSDQLDLGDRITLVQQLLWHGRTDDAVDILGRVRAATTGPRSDGAAAVRDTELWLAVTHPWLARRRQASTAPADNAAAVLAAQTDPWLHTAAGLADLLARGQVAAGVDRAEQVLAGLRLNRATAWAEESAMLALTVLVCADRAGTAAAWCDRLLADAHARQVPTWQAIVASARADIALRQGDLAAAADHAGTALTQLPAKGWGVAIGVPLGCLVLAATRMGDHDEAAKALTQAVPDAMFQSRYALPYLSARGHHHLATNHHHAALADFLSCGELVRGWGLDLPGLVPWRAYAAEAWLRLGGADQARELCYDQLARLGPGGGRVRGLTLRVLAAASPAGRRPQLLAEALDLLEDCDDRFEQARVLTDLSGAHHALDDDRRARMVFRRAWHLAAMVGGTPLRQELLAVPGDLGDPPDGAGAPAPDDGPPATPGAAALTGSERRVACLAVLGYTNREIAGKLVVTPSTVEQHLTHVYRKLHVKRRKDLPVELGARAS